MPSWAPQTFCQAVASRGGVSLLRRVLDWGSQSRGSRMTGAGRWLPPVWQQGLLPWPLHRGLQCCWARSLNRIWCLRLSPVLPWLRARGSGSLPLLCHPSHLHTLAYAMPLPGVPSWSPHSPTTIKALRAKTATFLSATITSPEPSMVPGT